MLSRRPTRHLLRAILIATVLLSAWPMASPALADELVVDNPDGQRASTTVGL